MLVLHLREVPQGSAVVPNLRGVPVLKNYQTRDECGGINLPMRARVAGCGAGTITRLFYIEEASGAFDFWQPGSEVPGL
ncbi:MAG: hypothetical protein ACFB13_21265 [Kiloniellaceae bacterium]